MSWGILFIYSGMVCAIVLPLMLLINWASPPSVLVNLTELKTPLGFAGTCLFFLLVFRNNSSYDRWWEGRKWCGGAAWLCCRKPYAASEGTSVHLGGHSEHYAAITF